MSSLEKLSFILVERQKANKLRRHYLYMMHKASDNLTRVCYRHLRFWNKESLAKHMKDKKDYHAAYRRVADLMNAQRPLLRELRKLTGARMLYNANNNCLGFIVDGKLTNWKDITIMHNTYVFESTVLKDSELNNPYAKELYGNKETKREEETETN